jgi:nucleoporin POM152
MRDPNNNLSFDKKGVYELIKVSYDNLVVGIESETEPHQVKDAHCEGDVMKSDSTFEIDYKPRPSVEIVTSHLLREKKGNYHHKGLCAGEEDQVAVHFSGQLNPSSNASRGKS